jgi:hypothetical protein
MTTSVKVARYHLMRPITFGLPWMNLAFAFAVNIIIYAQIPLSHHDVLAAHGIVSVANTDSRWTGAIAAMFATLFAVSVQAIGRSLPFGLTLGVSRRSYYAGTALVGVAMAFVNAAGITVLQAIERATNGWGVSMHFFSVPYLLNGPWYATWLTVFVATVMLFVYGMWYGIVHRRWGLIGTVTFVAAQVLVVLAWVLAVTWSHAWPSVGGFFTGLTALGLTGVIAVLAAVLLAGGHATIRRATV